MFKLCFLKVTAHTWAIFFQKIYFFSFFLYSVVHHIIRKITQYKENLPSSSKVAALIYGLCWLFHAAFWKLIKTSKIFCNSILYLKIAISNKHSNPLIIKNVFSNHSFAAIQVFFRHIMLSDQQSPIFMHSFSAITD